MREIDDQNQAPLTLRIKALRAGLSAAERRVVECVAEAPGRVLEWPVAELARASGTSDATVIRVCRRLGYTGYKQLTVAIARELGEQTRPVLAGGAIQPGTSLREIPGLVVGVAVDALQSTLRTLDPAEFERAVRALAGARRVELYGVGGSAAVAEDARHKLIKLGLACVAYGDPHLQLMSAVQLGAKDVAIGISHSGCTRDTIESMRRARATGATTIALTHQLATPLAETCAIRLLSSSHETDFFSEAMASRLAQLAIVDMLFAGLLARHHQRYLPRLEAANRAVAEKGQEIADCGLRIAD